jgi:acetyltransferase-like isoleucine patch superfamily enzyme
MRPRFANWGRRSRIEHSAKLQAPYLINVGSDVHICEHAWLNAKDDRGDGTPTMHIGSGSYIGRFAHINAWQEVRIGQNVLIADRVFISDVDHNFQHHDIPICYQGDSFLGPVTLNDGCWIGIGAVILPGVSIGRNSVVAANAVVTRSVPERVVVGGVPAKIIRHL